MLAQDLTGGAGRAAASEDERLSAAHVHAGRKEHPLKAEQVGVVAEERAVCAADDRVDAAGALRCLRQLGAVRHDILFIGDRHVQPVEAAARQKGGELLRRFFIQPVLVIAELGVNGGGIAVSQLAAEQSAAEHQTTSL